MGGTAALAQRAGRRGAQEGRPVVPLHGALDQIGVAALPSVALVEVPSSVSGIVGDFVTPDQQLFQY